jgi:hypothetical protein
MRKNSERDCARAVCEALGHVTEAAREATC